jgi:hypothetical protein
MTTIEILKAQRVWGKVARDVMINDIMLVLAELPLTADRKDIDKYLNECESKT